VVTAGVAFNRHALPNSGTGGGARETCPPGERPFMGCYLEGLSLLVRAMGERARAEL
jgi:hypothetical protein